MEQIASTIRGYGIFVEDNGVGGKRYFSDEVGGGVFVWDTCLVDKETLLICIELETGNKSK